MARSSGSGSGGGWQRCWTSMLLRRGRVAATLYDACDRARTSLVLDQLLLFLMCCDHAAGATTCSAGGWCRSATAAMPLPRGAGARVRLSPPCLLLPCPEDC